MSVILLTCLDIDPAVDKFNTFTFDRYQSRLKPLIEKMVDLEFSNNETNEMD